MLILIFYYIVSADTVFADRNFFVFLNAVLVHEYLNYLDDID